MNTQLRQDLKGCGWSMLHTPDWPRRLLQDLSFRRHFERVPYDKAQPALRAFADEMKWLLHEALADEWFYLDSVEIRHGTGHSSWHIDGGYVRVILTCQGDGTIAAKSFQDNVMTPPGHALVLTAQQRAWATGVPETWHSTPGNQDDRKLVLINFRNGD